MAGSDLPNLEFLQTNSVLGLGPIRENRASEKHFVSELKNEGLIDKRIYGIYLSPDDDIKSSIVFGDFD